MRSLSWLGLNALKVLGPRRYRSNYVVVTPPFLKTQWVFDRRRATLTRYETRDAVDVSVLHHIFLKEHYRLDNLHRGGAIFDRYAGLVEQKVVPLIIDCGANIGLSAAYFSD